MDADEPYARRSIGFLPPVARESAYELVRRRRTERPSEQPQTQPEEAQEPPNEASEGKEGES